ncbi:unnamed protein product [Leptidea sinapis]|uniref:TANC1/2-like AAA+ ATPase lid domain-containing protein n=1 Tax=Leptidea sinapis TaxID=189913 RepID=A0A5E4QH02_9NEOP|nr:unnamed protein product [Leptidea sinapis]
MSNMPIYSQVAPKMPKKKPPKEKTREFDPLNYNHGGNVQLLNAPAENRVEKLERREARRKEEAKRRTQRSEANEGKVEAYLRQNQPGQGAQARQARALNRRLLARHFLQGPGDSSERAGEFIRSLAMQILSHSSHARHCDREHSPRGDHLQPSNSTIPTNPFIGEDQDHYENHENLFLRNISQRQSKELRNSRLLRQSSEPLTEKKQSQLLKSHSTDVDDKSSPPKSRIPVANFRYPNKSELKTSAESSPKKDREELPEYQNIVNPVKDDAQTDMEKLLEKKRAEVEKNPPPIPTLPISPRTLIANAYYEKLLGDPEVQQALLPSSVESNPDESFKRAILFPLLEIDPPKHCRRTICFGSYISMKLYEYPCKTENDCSVVGLLSRHQHLLPHWLLLVATARWSSSLAAMFTGFRKITLDELTRAHVSSDVQRYVLSRLDTEPRLRARVSSDSAAAALAAAALDHLRIKSDGCLLYLEKVLDGVADGFIALREIREIPGTLNGLYLWLAQRLFHGRRFTKDTRDGPLDRLPVHLPPLVRGLAAGREALHAPVERAGDSQLRVPHDMPGTTPGGAEKNQDREEVLDVHTLVLLWVLDSGCDVEAALRREGDLRILVLDEQSSSEHLETGEPVDDVTGDVPDESLLPDVHELVAKGDDETLVAVLKNRPQMFPMY